MKKRPIIHVVLIALVVFTLSSLSRGDPVTTNDGTITVSSELLKNRYETVDPSQQSDASEVTKQLVGTGKITAVQGAQASGQASVSQGN